MYQIPTTDFGVLIAAIYSQWHSNLIYSRCSSTLFYLICNVEFHPEWMYHLVWCSSGWVRLINPSLEQFTIKVKHSPNTIYDIISYLLYVYKLSHHVQRYILPILDMSKIHSKYKEMFLNNYKGTSYAYNFRYYFDSFDGIYFALLFLRLSSSFVFHLYKDFWIPFKSL